MVYSNKGVAIKSTFDQAQTLLFASFMKPLLKEARRLGKAVGDRNSLDMIRIRTKTVEVMISTDVDHAFISVHQQIDENGGKTAEKEK